MWCRNSPTSPHRWINVDYDKLKVVATSFEPPFYFWLGREAEFV